MSRGRSSSQARAEVPADAATLAAGTDSLETAAFADAVLSGLARRPRSIPSRFLYDETGSALFEEITKLDEYYPTRTETALLERHGLEIAKLAGPVRSLVEFGSGSSRKTQLLIEALADLETYVPIDISEAPLVQAANRLEARFDGLSVSPIVGDFTQALSLDGTSRGRTLGFFSGSTIGNLSYQAARQFLERAAGLLGHGSAFLVGVDLKKSLDTLIPAYDDAGGVTASFSLNLLDRINRELAGTFDTAKFAHRAVYNAREGRIEIYLESLGEQAVHVLGERFVFAEGERIHTENSHKYTVDEFQALARCAGWSPAGVWTDAAGLFSLHLLRSD